ncbi:MAG: SH3 domain-containing protein, partial [Phycisphaeraceae bacterium]
MSVSRCRALHCRSAVFALLLVAVAGWPAAAQDVSYDGVVVEDVQIRSGAARAYYVVGELERNATVRVDEVIFDWLKVTPPEGVHSFISKAYVDARGDGSTGTVNANRSRVTAASVDGPGNSYREQVLLNRGDRVEILGEEGSFYRIAPPDGAFVFLPPGSVRRAADMQGAAPPADDEPAANRDTAAADSAGDATTAEPADDGTAESEASAGQIADTRTASRDADADTDSNADASGGANADSSADTSAAAPADDMDAVANTPGDDALAAAPVDAAAPDARSADADGDADADAAAIAAAEAEAREQVETPAVSDALRQVEQRHLPSFELPLEQQPIERMLADYREALEADDLPETDRRIAMHRIAGLERNERIAATLRSIAELREQAEQLDDELAARDAERDRRRREARQYNAVGELR